MFITAKLNAFTHVYTVHCTIHDHKCTIIVHCTKYILNRYYTISDILLRRVLRSWYDHPAKCN